MKTKRFLALIICMFISLSIFISPASAQEVNYSEHTISADDILGSEYFDPMTREEFIAEVALANNISYRQAESRIDQHIDASLSNSPAPTAWQGDTIVDNGDTTATVYGVVYTTYREPYLGYTVEYRAGVVMNQSHYGATWISVEYTQINPGSGNYNFYGTCSATIISTRELRLVLDGYWEIATTTSSSIGYAIYGFSTNRTVGETVYMRKNVYQVHIEKTSVQGG